MRTIGQLARFAGATVRAVRHYHQVGLLPEPARDASGYRSYGAPDVVLLVRIRTLASAGVPLGRVQELLAAGPQEFGEGLARIDADLRARIRELQEHRRRIARLADGGSLALPPVVRTYLDKLRAVGASQAMVEGERDAWIIIAARWPEKIEEFMADKLAQLDDARVVRLYQLLDQLIADGVDGLDDAAADPLLDELAYLIVVMAEEWAAAGEPDRYQEEMSDQVFVNLIDTFASDSLPVVERLKERVAERGWGGWTRMERTSS